MSFIVNPYAFDVNNLIGPNTGLHLDFGNLAAMLVEGDIPVTQVSTDGNSVGCIYDQSVNGLILRNSTSGERPVLGSDGTRNSFITFDGTNDRIPILSSLSFFNTFWQTVPKGTMLFWIKFNGGDGSAQRIIDNNDGTTTNPGMQIFKDASNKIVARAGDGTIRWTVTSSTSITVASGWTGVIVSVNGVGSGGSAAGRLILINSSGTVLESTSFDVAAGTAVNAQTNFMLGSRLNTPNLFLNASISCIICENFPVSDSLINQFKIYNPPRSTTEFAPIVQYLFDMNNNAYIFRNDAGTILCNDGDPVRVVRSNITGNFNTIGGFGALRRNIFNLVGDSVVPTFQTNVLNGKSALLFDGVDDELNFLSTCFEELGGKWTFFLVVENLDSTFGSHFLSGNNYVVVTGSAYSGASPPTTVNPYAVVHPNPAGTQVHTNLINPGTDGPRVMAFRRDRSNLAAWNGAKTKTTSTSSSLFSINNMGEAHSGPGADWNAHGYVFYFKKYNGVMSDSAVEAEIDRLNSEYGL